MIALIINFNRLTYPKTMVEWCKAHQLTPIIVDNHSDYGPLLDWYKTDPCRVIGMSKNYGHTVVWNKEEDVLSLLGIEGRYIVTDPDLDLTGIPGDFLEVLERGLDMYSHVDKCGFSLEIRDLPNSPEGNLIGRQVEPRYWRKLLPGGYWNAAIDTTFALYREGIVNHTHIGIRADRPYTARHLPWYYTDLKLLPEDEQYYYAMANQESCTGRNRFIK